MTSSRLIEKVGETVDRASNPKVIEMYRCWTPDQLPLLKCNVQRVMFLSAPSTGKTALMEAEAISCVENGIDAVFFIPNADCDDVDETMCPQRNVKTLLALRMEDNFERLRQKFGWKNSKLKVHSFKRNTRAINFEHLIGLIQSDEYQHSAIFIDEVFIFNYSRCLKNLKKIAELCGERKLWIAISAITSTVRGELNDITIDKVKKIFKDDFYIPELLNPIRNSSGILKAAYPSLAGKILFI